MTQVQFIVYLLTSGNMVNEAPFKGDLRLLGIVTTPPLGYSIYERRSA